MRIILFAVQFRLIDKFHLAEANSRMTYRGGGSEGHPPLDFEGREKRIEPNRIHYYSPLKIFEPSAASHLVDHKSN